MDNHLPKSEDNLKEAINRASQILKDSRTKAKAATAIFIIGSYKDESKKSCLFKLRDAIKGDLGVPSFLMEDLMRLNKEQIDDATDGKENFKVAFDVVCDAIQKSYNWPFVYLYASKNLTSGPISELVDICENPKKLKLKDHFHIFLEEGCELPHQAKSLPYKFNIQNGEGFIEKAIEVTMSHIEEATNLIRSYNEQ